jgi:hypothetical protein
MPADIAFADYDALCLLAREFNAYAPPERVKATAAAAPSDARGNRPGDE